jgi:hypothetical protein
VIYGIQNFRRKCRIWLTLALKIDVAKFENYFLLPKTTEQFVTYPLLVWHLSSWYLLVELKVLYFTIKYQIVQNPFLEITYILVYLHILVL